MKFDTILDFSDDWPGYFVITDSETNILAASSRFHRLFTSLGLSSDKPPSLLQLMTPASRMIFETTMLADLLAGGEIQDFEATLRGPESSSIPVLIAALRNRIAPERFHWILLPTPRRAKFEQELVETRQRLAATVHALAEANERLKERQSVIARQTHELEKRNLELVWMASHDPLTRLLNRRGFLETINQREVSKGHQSDALLMIDIDHFKNINDTMVHSVGDEVLRAVASVLSATCRQRDVVARIGGEEFVVWCREVNLDQVRQIAERIRAAVEAHHYPNGLAFASP